MKLARLDIENFRGIKNLSIPFDDTTVLIGENNSGKSSILEALRACLSHSVTRKSGQFTEYDFHLPDGDSEPTTAKPISITLYFAEEEADEWPDSVVRGLDPATQIDANSELNTLTLRVTSSYDSISRDFTTQWDFLNGSGNPLTRAKNPRLIYSLAQLSPLFYLAAIRNAAQEFRPRSAFWGPFVRSAKIDDDTRRELEESLSELNQQILDSHTTFDVVKERLKKTAKLVPLAKEDPISIEALPGKVFDMLSKTQIMLTGKSGSKLPLLRHGEGTQSLAVMFLFDAFLESRLSEEYDKDAEPILAMEEPEAHLHPSAIRSLAVLLQKLKGQKLISTHSGDLLAGIPLKSIRRLARKDGEIKLYRVKDTTFSSEELDKVTYHIRSERGRLLFARCWLLVEGQSEYRVLPEMARLVSLDLDTHGVCCFEFSQFGAPELIIRLAENLGIHWHLLADNDPAGKGYVKSAQKALNGPDDIEKHITCYPEDGDELEHHLWRNGYKDIYISALTTNLKKKIKITDKDPEYINQVLKALGNRRKTRLSSDIVSAAALAENPKIPPSIMRAIEQSILLAESTQCPLIYQR